MSDVVIIGSGISGMLVARELCAENVSVTIVERTPQTGQESSWAGGGIISPLYPWRYDDAISRLAQWSQQVYQRLCTELCEQTGIDPEWTKSGLLVVSDEIERATQWGAQFGQPVEVVNADGMHEIEPTFAKAAGQGIWLPEVAQVRNPRLLKSLQAYLLANATRFLTDTEVQDFIVHNGVIKGIKTSAGDVFADKVVVAGGAWSQLLMARVGPLVPEVEPVLGQMLLFKTKPGLIKHIVLSEQRYAIPRRDGHILFGSTLERVGFDKQITETARDELQAIAQDYFPVLADWPVVHHWAGLRPGSPKGIPYIYEHPDVSGLFVNCGHYRNGVVLGPASARLLADMLLDRPTILPIEPYGVAARGIGQEID